MVTCRNRFMKNQDLICKVGKIANGKATLVLETENKAGDITRQKIEVCQSVLPRKIKENDELVLKLFTRDDAQKNQKELAKNILNDILDIK